MDGIRFIAIAFVVMLHTRPFADLGLVGNWINFAITTSARFGVPIFFLISGFFFARKVRSRGLRTQYGRYTNRILAIYLVALLVNAPVVLLFRAGSAIVRGREVPWALTSEAIRFLSLPDLFYYGTSVVGPLWFLTALLLAVTFVSLFALFKAERLILPIAFSFHVVGLFGQGYDFVLAVPFATRDALFFGFFYVAVGYVFGRRSELPSDENRRIFGFLAVAGLVLQFVEMYALGYVVGNGSVSPVAGGVFTTDYTVATMVMSVSLFAFLLVRPDTFAGTRLETYGRYALGIYIIHPAVLRLVRGIGFSTIELVFGYDVSQLVVTHVLLTPFVICVSTGLFVLLRRQRVISRAERVVSALFEGGRRRITTVPRRK